MKHACVCAFWGLLAALPTRATAQPTGPAKPAEGFLSAVVEVQPKVDGKPADPKYGGIVHRPTATRLDTPYYDVPFAVNVPFQVPFEGGAVRVYFRTAVHWPEAPKEFREHRFTHSRGVLRADGAPLAEGSVFFDLGGETDRDGWAELKSDELGPVRVWGFPQEPGRELTKLAVAAEDTKHTPFSDGHFGSFVFAPAKAGTYAFWFSMDESAFWERLSRTTEALEVRYRVDLLVCRGERPVTRAEFEYLFGRGKRPEGMPEDKFFVPLSAEIPATLRRNGWVFDRVEVGPADDRFKQKRWVNNRSYPTDVEATSSPGRSTSCTLNVSMPVPVIKMGEEVLQPYVWKEKYEWKIDFPAEMPDFGFAEIKLAGGSEFTGRQGKADPRDSGSAPLTQWRPLSRNAHCTFAHFSQIQPNDPRRKREDFLAQYGKESERFWFEDWRTLEALERGPAVGGGGPLRYLMSGDRPRDRALLAQTGGSAEVVAFVLGGFDVRAYYRRASEVRQAGGKSGTGGNEGKLIVERDPYWEWYPGFSRTLRKARETVDAARFSAAMIAGPLSTLRAKNARLHAVLTRKEDPAPAALSARFQAQFKKQTDEVHDYLERSERIIAGAVQAMDGVVSELDAAASRFGERHGDLFALKHAQQEVRERLPFELALAAGNHEKFREGVAAGRVKAYSAETRMLLARALLADGESVGALFELRDALALEPGHVEAGQRLAELEAAFLKASLDKAQGAVGKARAAFAAYMNSRGFAEVEPEKRAPWLRAALGIFDEANREELWAAFSMGVTGAASGLLGRPGAEADLLDVTQKKLATAFLGLHAMMRLRVRGFTLAQMRTIDADALLRALPLKDLAGNPYTPAQAAALRSAMLEALDLPDVAALAGGADRATLERAMEAAYWSPRDAADTAAESFGDAVSSPKALILFLLPSATVVNAAGKTVTVGETLAIALRWDRAIRALGGTRAGAHLLSALKRTAEFEQTLLESNLLLTWAGLQGAKIAALCVLQYQAVTKAEALGGPYAAMVVEAVLTLLPTDSELLLKWLAQHEIPPARVAGAIGKYLTQTETAARAAESAAARRTALRQIAEAQKQGKGLPPAALEELDRLAGRTRAPTLPVGDAIQDGETALASAAASARNGTDDGALGAAEALARDADEQAAALLKQRQAALEAQRRMAGTPARRNVRELGASLPQRLQQYRPKIGDPPLPDHLTVQHELLRDPSGCVPNAIYALQPDRGHTLAEIETLIRDLRNVRDGRLVGVDADKLPEALRRCGLDARPGLSIIKPTEGELVDNVSGALRLGKYMERNQGATIIANVAAPEAGTGHAVLIWKIEADPAHGAVVYILDPFFGSLNRVPLKQAHWRIADSAVAWVP